MYDVPAPMYDVGVPRVRRWCPLCTTFVPGPVAGHSGLLISRPGSHVDHPYGRELLEISSPGTALVARAVKPQLYAQAGVPHHLQIEQGEAGPGAVVCRLNRGRYTEVTRVVPGQPLALTHPIEVTLDLAALAAATRPPG